MSVSLNIDEWQASARWLEQGERYAPPYVRTIELLEGEVADLGRRIERATQELVVQKARRYLGRGDRLVIDAHEGRVNHMREQLEYKEGVLDGLRSLRSRGEIQNCP